MNTSSHWHLLPSFLAVLEHGSLLAASRALGVHQPTVGRHIAELEAHLRRPLFERTGRGLRPTAAALHLRESAQRMSEAADDFMRIATSAETELAGRVRLSASEPVACYLLPPLLGELQQAQPTILIDLVVENRVSNLLAREADIALRLVKPAQQSLIARRMGTVSISAYAHSGYLRQHGHPAGVGDLAGHRLIGFDRSDEVKRGFLAHGIHVPDDRFAFRSDNLIACWQAVRAGLGIGFVADFVARSDNAVERVIPHRPVSAYTMWLVSHRELRSNRRIRAVFDFLSARLPSELELSATAVDRVGAANKKARRGGHGRLSDSAPI